MYGLCGISDVFAMFSICDVVNICAKILCFCVIVSHNVYILFGVI